MNSNTFLKNQTELNKKIVIKVTKTKEQTQNKQKEDEKLCRICLSSENKYQLIKPCQCSGSLQFVHNECLIQWLNHIVIKNAELNKQSSNIHCEICKQNLQVQYGKKLECKDFKTILETIKINKYLATICLIFILMSIWVIGILLFFKMNQDQSKRFIIDESTFIAVFIVTIFHTLVWIAIFGYCFFTRWQFYVKNVKPKDILVKKQINNKNKMIDGKDKTISKIQNVSQMIESKTEQNMINTNPKINLNSSSNKFQGLVI